MEQQTGCLPLLLLALILGLGAFFVAMPVGTSVEGPPAPSLVEVSPAP